MFALQVHTRTHGAAGRLVAAELWTDHSGWAMFGDAAQLPLLTPLLAPGISGRVRFHEDPQRWARLWAAQDDRRVVIADNDAPLS